MAQRAKRLKDLLAASRRTADQAQKSFLRAEDALNGLEEREARRSERAERERAAIEQRMPNVRGRH